MKSLLILRHAKSSWSDESLSDHDRPLNDRGKRDAPRMGQLIKQQGLTPDRILCSTAKRARKTAHKVAEACDCPQKVEQVGEFYLASPEAYLEVLRQQDDSLNRVMVVGHNPGLEELLRLLTSVRERLPTAALAHVDLDIDGWMQLDSSSPASLLGLWRPREME